MKIVFMGTPEFAMPALQALINSEHEIVAVYTAPPKPAGRGKQLRKSAIHLLAEKYGIEAKTPASLKEENLPECDAAVVAAYGILLPKHILDVPKYGCLNIHPSLLPRWRGAAPVQRAIMAGDAETAICIMKMDEGLDTGDILMQKNLDIPRDMSAGDLHDQTAITGAVMVLYTLADIETLTPKPQGEEGMTYARKVVAADQRINWLKSSEEIYNQVRGLNPFPAAYFMYEGEKFKVFACRKVDGEGKAGEVIDDMLKVACGDGAIKIVSIQRPGKRPVGAEDFLRGFKLEKGTVLETES